MTSFIELYNEYMHRKDGVTEPFSDFAPWKAFVAKNSDHAIATQKDITIQVIGVWDTVGSLGIPDLGHFWKWHKADQKAYEFYDTSLNDRKFNHHLPFLRLI